MIPHDILEEVDQIAGKRRRSLFIAEATREKVQRERFPKVLSETQGAWIDKNPSGLRTTRGIEQFMREKRKSYRKRLKGIMNE